MQFIWIELFEFYLAEGSPLENKFFKDNPNKEYVAFVEWVTRSFINQNYEGHGY